MMQGREGREEGPDAREGRRDGEYCSLAGFCREYSI